MMDEEAQLLETQAAAAAQAAEEAQANEQQVNYYLQLIKAKVQRYLRLPPAATAETKVVLELKLYPDGEVLDVKVVQSSGIASFDEAAIAAVRKARSLPVPDDLKLFRANFARFNAVIRPGDLDG